MRIPSNIIDLYSRLTQLHSPSRKARSANTLEFQKLEPRMLLAGDVTVFVDANFGLRVLGDNADNQIQIIGTRMSGARVVGLNGTTINGGNTEFNSGIGLRSLSIQMNGGNDEVDILGAKFNFGIQLQGNAGNDLLKVRNSSIGGLNIQAGNGDDLVEIENVFVVNSSVINMSSGNDTIAIYNQAAGGDIVVRGGSGNDTMAVDRMGMFERLDVDMGSGNDQVLFAGETWMGQNSMIYLGAGNDFLGLMPGQNGGKTQLQMDTVIDGGSGDDNVALDSSVVSVMGATIDGNAGTDGYSYDGKGLMNTSVVRFENAGFDVNAAMDSVYKQLSDEGIDPTRFGGSASFILGIDIDSTQLNYTENDPAVAIDPFLELSGVSSTVVESATVSIDGFVPNQDILEFSHIANPTIGVPNPTIPTLIFPVVGVYDDATGILTFSGVATLADYQTVLRSVTYRNSSESPSEAPRTLQIELNTTDASVKESRALAVFEVNDIPELNVRDSTLDFDIDDGNLDRPAILDTNLTLSDVDTAEFKTATVSIVGGILPGDVLGFVGADGITGSYDSSSGVLTLSGSATIEAYEKALRSVTFDNTNDRAQLGTRTIRFETTDGQTLVSDQFDVEVVASQTIEVTTTIAAANYLETDPPLTIDSALVVNADNGDPDAKVDGATVSIVSGYDSNQDRLAFSPVDGITGTFDESTGILTLTGDSTAENYEKVLRSVTFVNSSFGDFDFSTADRVVEFGVERAGLTATASRTINVSEFALEQALIERYLELNGLTSEKTASGLHYVVQQQGDGNFPNENSRVTVNYVGTLLNGEEFDSGNGISFSLQSVIAGWTEGIPKFSTGGGGLLLIPSDLAYGASPPAGIPVNAVLVFEVDLLSWT